MYSIPELVVMNQFLSKSFKYFIIATVLSIISCKENKQPVLSAVVESPLMMDEKVQELIKGTLSYAAEHNGLLGDSLILYQWPGLINLYKQKSFVPFWSGSQQWKPQGDELLRFIQQAKLYGLFPEDYHWTQLSLIKTAFEQDSAMQKERKDAALWSRADLLLSDALVNIFHDIKIGRLPGDSITLRKDSVLNEETLQQNFMAVFSGNSLDSVIRRLEPVHPGYHRMKSGLKHFLDSARILPVELISFPDKDSFVLKTAIKKRLAGLGYLDSASVFNDSLKLSSVLLKYQKNNRLTADGKIGMQTIRSLNLSDEEKFKRIAITLDRYKMLPEKMPEKYIWVNIPAFELKLFYKDTVRVSSRVVVGKPKTRTPVLTSSLSELITYPQWVIPQSIIVKEILPSLKKNPGYLARKGYSLFDNKGEELDPFSIDWSKFNKGIPYRIIQGSGDENALGVLKFNFGNKYSVYLHDTNQRSFFGLDSRALSHGCVRVQEWEKLAHYILLNENRQVSPGSKSKTTPLDSLTRWLQVKEKHQIPLQNRIPLFIRYYTCDIVNDRIIFFDDIYEEDKELADRLFSTKKIRK
jgi:murein L,D-transpeptidase YcbB/YkuD